METILIATDFSEAAKNATNYGASLAKLFSSDIILLNTYPVPPASSETGFTIEMITSMNEGAREALQKLKEEINTKHQRHFTIDCVAEMGTPLNAIESIAHTRDVNLIVMGITNHASVLKEHVVGSSAVNVARHSKIPTLIVPQNVPYRRIRKVTFACDLDKTEESYVAYITKYFVSIFDAELDILTIQDPAGEISDEQSKSELFLEKKLESIKHKITRLTDKSIIHGLENYLKDHPCDLLIVNPKKHPLFHHLFHENVTRGLAFHLQVPILAIH